MAVAMLLMATATMLAPPGLDSRHIPSGSPLGSLPIVIRPGEPVAILHAPMTEAQWLASRRAAIARASKDPRNRAIMRRVEELERNAAERERSGEP